MDSAITDEILEELSLTLQRVETQSAAILEFVKDKGIAKEEDLAPYLERASAASSVRWRAVRVRLARLLAGLEKSEQQAKADADKKARAEEPEPPTEKKLATKPEMAKPVKDVGEQDKRAEGEKTGERKAEEKHDEEMGEKSEERAQASKSEESEDKDEPVKKPAAQSSKTDRDKAV